MNYKRLSFVLYNSALGKETEFIKYDPVIKEKEETIDNTHVISDDRYSVKTYINYPQKVFSDPNGELTIVYKDYHSGMDNIAIEFYDKEGIIYRYFMKTKPGRSIQISAKIRNILANTYVDNELYPIKNLNDIAKCKIVGLNGCNVREILLTSDIYTENQTLNAELNNLDPSVQKMESEGENDINDEEIHESFTVDKKYTGLLPNEIYNFYFVKTANKTSNDILKSDNLVYITQTETDINGNAFISLSNDIDEYETFAVPMNRIDISKAEVKVSDLTPDGNVQYVKPVVTINGEVLKEGIDYYLTDDFCATEEGKYKVTICGIGIYTGTVSKTYKVDKNNKADNTSLTDTETTDNETTSDENRSFTKGDVNSDAQINVTDIAMIASHIKGIKALDTHGTAAADVNKDDAINVTDIAMISSHIKGIKALVA